MKQFVAMTWAVVALSVLLSAAPTPPQAKKDVCTGTVDPYNPQAQRTALRGLKLD